MKVAMNEKWAYVDLGQDRILCIGTAEEVKTASADQICRMVYESFMTNIYEGIKTSKDRTVH